MVGYVLLEFGGVHTACGCKSVHKCRGSGRCLNFKALGISVQKKKEDMLGSNLLDAIPCDVKAEISQTATKAEYISDIGIIVEY